MNKLTIRDMKLQGQRVLTRVDFNVPLDDQGRISDEMRLKATLPTLEHIIKEGGKLVLMSHLGRPKGKKVDKLKMDPVADALSRLLDRPVKKLDGVVGPEIEKKVSKMNPGEMVLLENLRFYPEEESNDGEFSKQLAFLGDLYINDAFACSHRAHASIVGVAHYLKAGAGLLMAKEIEYLARVLELP